MSKAALTFAFIIQPTPRVIAKKRFVIRKLRVDGSAFCKCNMLTHQIHRKSFLRPQPEHVYGVREVGGGYSSRL